jgi:hypothetical protein
MSEAATLEIAQCNEVPGVGAGAWRDAEGRPKAKFSLVQDFSETKWIHRRRKTNFWPPRRRYAVIASSGWIRHKDERGVPEGVQEKRTVHLTVRQSRRAGCCPARFLWPVVVGRAGLEPATR